MMLYLLRHAEAGEAPRDEDRELTEHGHAQAAAAAAGIDWLNLNLTSILSSPLPRATQTAQPVARVLGLALETVEALAPGQDPSDGLAVLAGRGDRLLLVGHEPQLSGIIGLVTDGRARMRKAMLAAIDLPSVESPQGTLDCLLSWRHLQRLGRKKEQKSLL
jgi:phosphohistidine phosphatase